MQIKVHEHHTVLDMMDGELIDRFVYQAYRVAHSINGVQAHARLREKLVTALFDGVRAVPSPTSESITHIHYAIHLHRLPEALAIVGKLVPRLSEKHLASGGRDLLQSAKSLAAELQRHRNSLHAA